MSIISFLSPTKRPHDTTGIHKSAATWLLHSVKKLTAPALNFRISSSSKSKRKVQEKREQWQLIRKWWNISWKRILQTMLLPKWTLRPSTIHRRLLWCQQTIRKPFRINHSAAIVFMMKSSWRKYASRGSMDRFGTACLYIGARRTCCNPWSWLPHNTIDQLATCMAFAEHGARRHSSQTTTMET